MVLYTGLMHVGHKSKTEEEFFTTLLTTQTNAVSSRTCKHKGQCKIYLSKAYFRNVVLVVCTMETILIPKLYEIRRIKSYIYKGHLIYMNWPAVLI